MPVRQATPQETRDWLGKGLVMPGQKQHPPSAAPSDSAAPMRQSFGTQEEFEEAVGFWQSRIGRLRGMRGVTLTAASPVSHAASPASPPAPSGEPQTPSK